MNRRLLVLVAGGAFALAGCGSSATSTGTPAATAAPTVTEAPASAAVESQAPASADASGPDVSLQPGAAGDLEAMLPSEANGITFKKSSFDGSSLGLAGVPIDAGELKPVLEANGKTVNDVRFALATPTATGSGPAAIVMAFQIKGVPAEKLLPVLDSSGNLGDLKETTIAGKSVRTGGTPPFGAAIYLKDDVLFYVLFADQPTTESIISQLP